MKEIFDKILQTEQNPQLEIPDLDLYVDQITTLFEKNLSSDRRSEKDKLLTKSMINNYSKEGVLKSIKGKKYSRAHVIMMQLIYSLKKTLSITDIKALLNIVDSEIIEDKHSYNATKVEKLYAISGENRLVANELLGDFLRSSSEKISLSGNKKEDLLLLSLYLSDVSAQLKQASEAIIDSSKEE